MQPSVPNLNPTPAEMLRQWSVQSRQALVEPEPEPGVEELWEQEMERLWSSQALVREVPYAMVDKRFIRWVSPGRDWVEARWWGWAERPEDAPVGWGWKSPAAGRLLWPLALLCLGRWAQWVIRGRPHHHPIPGSCGSPRG